MAEIDNSRELEAGISVILVTVSDWDLQIGGIDKHDRRLHFVTIADG